MGILTKLSNSPLLVAILGWALFPSMYLVVGILTTLGFSIERAFLIAMPLGLTGFSSWVIAFALSALNLIKRDSFFPSLLGLALSSIPLAFCSYGFWIAANGGV